MRQKTLRSQSINAIKTAHKTPLIRLLFAGIMLLASVPFTGNAQSGPVFQGGTPQSFTVCENGPAYDISTMLTIIDPDVDDTESYTIVYGPTHGVVSGFPDTAISNGSLLDIGPGLTYTPAAGYFGLDSFQVMVDDNTGNTDVITFIVTINPPPTVDVIAGPTSVCIGGNILLTDDSLGGVWAATNGNAMVAGGIVTGMSLGMDTISYTISGTCGSTTVTTNVTVTLLPDAGTIYGSALDVCPASTISLSNVVGGGVWSASNTNASVSPTGDVLGLSTGVVTISYSVTLICGTSVATVEVTVNSFPISGVITGPSVVCEGSNITLTDGTAGGFWRSQTGRTTVTPGTGVVAGVTAGLDTIYYVVTNSCDSSRASHPITVNPLAVAGVITGTVTAVCVGSGTILANSAPGGVWSAVNAHGTVTGPLVTGVSGGVDTILYTVTNSCSSAIAAYTITINPLAYAGAISGLTSVCVADSIYLTNPTAGGVGVWSVLNSHAAISSAGGVLTGVSAGRDTVVFTYTNMCSTAATSFIVTVNPLPNAGVINGPGTVCVHYMHTLIDTTSGGIWSTSSTIITVGTSGVVTGISAGTAVVTYTYTNMCGTVYATHTQTVLALPDSGVITGLNTVCTGSSITLSNLSPGGTWSSGSGGAAVSSGGVVSGISAGVITISYSVANSCRTAVTTHTVTVNTIPSAGTISGDTVICPNVLLQLNNPVTGGVWTKSNANADIDALGGIAGVVPGSFDTFTYTVTNACGSANTSFVVHIQLNPICWHTYVAPVSALNAAFEIYPNPATDELTIKIDNGAYNAFIITNQLGQMIMKHSLNATQTEVGIHALAPGLYNITLTGENGVVTRKMIKQ
jgi:hypothetical protein